jgi:hypothetical protein
MDGGKELGTTSLIGGGASIKYINTHMTQITIGRRLKET